MNKEELFEQLKMMNAGMHEGQQNLVKIIKENEDLTNLIIDADKNEQFKDFTEEQKKQTESYKSQSQEMLDRLNSFDEVINQCEVNEDAKNLIVEFMFATGFFRNGQ